MSQYNDTPFLRACVCDGGSVYVSVNDEAQSKVWQGRARAGHGRAK